MKSILLLAILMFLITGAAFSQTENFEDDPSGLSSFSVDGLFFKTTGDLFIELIPTYGCNHSDRFLGSGTLNGGSSGSFGSIKVNNPEDKFTISTSLPWCAFVSLNDGAGWTSGDVKFTGTLTNGGTIEEIFTVEPISGQAGWGEITFSSEIWYGQELRELKASMVSNLNYLALDNIVFENNLTSVSNIQKEGIKIYPNPTEGEIEIIGIDALEVKIIDAFGRIVREQSLFNQKIDISDLVDGVYYISINTRDQQISKRVIKH